LVAEGQQKHIFERKVTANGGKVSDTIAPGLTHVVIANEVGSSRAEQLSRKLAERSCKVPVVAVSWVLQSVLKIALEEPKKHLYEKYLLEQKQEKDAPEECPAEEQQLMYGSESDEDFVEQQNNQAGDDYDGFPPKYSCCYSHR
jgi:hypothetical protein